MAPSLKQGCFVFNSTPSSKGSRFLWRKKESQPISAENLFAFCSRTHFLSVVPFVSTKRTKATHFFSEFSLTCRACHVKCTLHFRPAKIKKHFLCTCVYPVHLAVSCTLSICGSHGNQTSFFMLYSTMGLNQTTEVVRAGADFLLKQS